MPSEGETILHGRYTLTERISDNGRFWVWKARDAYGGPMLIKAWPYEGAAPSEVRRALWDVELRHLFRLASLPEADDHLVVLKDAAVDKTAGLFVMALMAPGLSPLEGLLRDRQHCKWLRELALPAARADLWRGIKGLALGLMQLHAQHMLHRAISAQSVLVEPTQGPSTMRLSGFEWTVQLGSEWTPPLLPPDESTGAYSFESDWFHFGALAARLVAAAEPPQQGDPKEKHEFVLRRVRERDKLLPAERDLLERLLTHDADARLARGYEIVERINDLLISLDEPARRAENSYLALLALLGPQRPLTLAIFEQDATISSLTLEDQRAFIENDLKAARLVRQQGGAREGYILMGQRLNYYITEHAREKEMPTGAWDLAYCNGAAELRFSTGSDDQVVVDRLPIKVFTLSAFFKDENVVRRGAVPWKALLPRQNRGAAGRERLERFHDFFRVTNQIELLMRDAEIFAYEIRSKRVVDGAEEVILREMKRSREPLDFTKMAEGLPEYLNRQSEGTPEERLVYLGPEEGLDVGRRVDRPEFWTVIDANPETRHVKVRRPRRPDSVAAPDKGFLRSFEMFGQMSLITRRRRAIERLKGHAYLLQALQRPDFVHLDTGNAKLPQEIDEDKIDRAKRSAMGSIWRMRPIFALQGPPGTGKTTLVANLLGQIFADDPVAQVLVTAQAHAAVDVLLNKVSKEIFQDADTTARPLSVRLPRKKDDDREDPDYVESVTYRMLDGAIGELEEEPCTPLQQRWLDGAREAAGALRRRDMQGPAADLCEIVKRSAGITYSTTTAGNLAELADTTQTFDWSIIEEAGKAHGFDLVLPLQTGHRWLLIGDQDQLPPYRFPDFQKALSRLPDAFDALTKLPDRAGWQLDTDLVSRWKDCSAEEQAARRELWRDWLEFFRNLYKICFQARAAGGETADAGDHLAAGDVGEVGPAVLAQMLGQQHRMHPTIGALVSKAYYRGTIENETADKQGCPLERVVHPFSEPAALAGKAIVWLDVSWVAHGGSGEAGPKQGDGRYTSSDEVSAVQRFIAALRTHGQTKLRLAVLSPYRLQVRALNDALRKTSLPAWVSTADKKREKGPAFTVDSFQGDEADIVVVSLVRNNSQAPGHGLGFLREAQRMNVLFSRAERLLVLVGSWDFFQHQLRDTPPDHEQPLGKWRIAIEYLDECFKTGAAIKLPLNSLPRLS